MNDLSVPRSVRDSLRRVGLEAHARVFDEMIAACEQGLVSSQDDARYIRAHASAIRWSRIAAESGN